MKSLVIIISIIGTVIISYLFISSPEKFSNEYYKKIITNKIKSGDLTTTEKIEADKSKPKRAKAVEKNIDNPNIENRPTQKNIQNNATVIKHDEINDSLILKLTKEFEQVLGRKPNRTELLELFKNNKQKRVQTLIETQFKIENSKKIIEEAKAEGNDELVIKTEQILEKQKASIELLEKKDLTKEDEEELRDLLE